MAITKKTFRMAEQPKSSIAEHGGGSPPVGKGEIGGQGEDGIMSDVNATETEHAVESAVASPPVEPKETECEKKKMLKSRWKKKRQH